MCPSWLVFGDRYRMHMPTGGVALSFMVHRCHDVVFDCVMYFGVPDTIMWLVFWCCYDCLVLTCYYPTLIIIVRLTPSAWNVALLWQRCR